MAAEMICIKPAGHARCAAAGPPPRLIQIRDTAIGALADFAHHDEPAPGSTMNVATDTSTAERALGEIARELAGAAAVFRRYGLDYCCGGSQSLGEAAAAAGVDPRAVERDLAALAPAPAEAPEEPLPLIDHILVRYHETHRRELPELIALARRVEERHAGHPQVPRGLTKLLEHMAEALEEHMQKEEQILFPMMRSGATPMVMGPIEVMEHEHVEHGEKLRQLESLTNRHTAPADACTSWLALYAGTRKLVDDVMQHIHLENNVLFPQFTQ
jgi:regulator of cell morphogenesis and NO signaling